MNPASVAVDIGRASYGSQATVTPSEYYYVLVFPNTPHALNAGATSRISFCAAKDVIRSVTSGSDESKEAAVAEFERAWITKFRSLSPVDTDIIPQHFFHELMRVIVIQRLEAVPGLALATQISKDEQNIYCYVRLTREGLFRTAGLYQTNLPIWHEIDPGSQYWLDQGHHTKQIAPEDAEKELQRLFLEGHLSAEEAQVFATESPVMVSRRIEAVKRISNAAIQTKYPPTATMYFPYQHDPAFQYLYAEVDDNMPFRGIEKIRLTKATLDEAFDCDLLQQRASGDDVSLDLLCDQWGALTAPVYLYTHGLCASWRVVFYQPITAIRDYFGEQLALYFAFMSFYAEMLLVLLAIGLADTAVSWVIPDSVRTYYDTALASVNCLYACVIVKKWAVRQQTYACSWGMTDVKADASVRAAYQGVIRVSPITNAPELFSPVYVQMTKKVYSSCMLLLAISLNGAAIFGVFALQIHAEAVYTTASFVEYSYLAIALLITLSQRAFQPLVVWLNEIENHRTHHTYDVALTVKFAVFQTMNAFGPILFSAFLKPYVFGCNKTALPTLDAAACATETANLLLAVLLTGLLLSIWDIAAPLSHALCQAYTRLRHRYAALAGDAAVSPRTMDDEFALGVYEGVLFDYAQISTTFGYVAWFGAVAPQAALVALAITLVQIRVDAYKLCYLMQRPAPQPASSIGGWMIYFRMLTLAGVVVNAANVAIGRTLAVQAHLALEAITASNWLDQLFVVTVLMTVLYVASVVVSIPDAGDREALRRIKSTLKRQTYLRETYLFQLTSKDKFAPVERESGAVYLNGVYRYIVSGDTDDGEQVDELREELSALEHRIRTFPKIELEPMGVLFVVVVGANILPVMDRSTKALDAFVKVRLKQGDKVLLSKHKTPVKKSQRSPVWNAAFEFKLSSLETLLHLEVLDWNLVGRSIPVGTAVVPVTRALTNAVDFADAAVEGVCNMVALDVPIELEDGLLARMASDIPKFGRPVLHINMGVRINQRGCQGLRLHNFEARAAEITKTLDTFLVWKPKSR
ncbi:hypothetical protein ACHHYP_15769 [Achlya hypogyna]|uniref:C2 domain-containing protein n=1 Tax=Achlya hypogyna TaxID=1202772 RepID=A0A1V9ZEQ1_ACHHY|nr:hypothetical protein ACHHYP_15769 [Achlya hypogyna]